MFPLSALTSGRYNPVSREQFDEEVFKDFYNDNFSPPSPPSDSASSHRLALTFILFAIGTLMDPNEEPYNLEAEKYHQLSRAALFKSSIFDDPTLHAVQALVSCSSPFGHPLWLFGRMRNVVCGAFELNTWVSLLSCLFYFESHPTQIDADLWLSLYFSVPDVVLPLSGRSTWNRKRIEVDYHGLRGQASSKCKRGLPGLQDNLSNRIYRSCLDWIA